MALMNDAEDMKTLEPLRKDQFSLDPTIRLTFISLLLCGLVSVLNDMSSQVIAQRYLCASTSRTAQKSTLLALPLEALRILMFASTGIALYAFYNNKLTALIPAVNNTDTLSNIDDVTAPRYEPNYKEPEQVL
uniref:Uncharacterized protein LOC102810176 n=1 Tax=Saccoglossus kowalevskii TaxID=10224 RepID=A0ABM0ML40_SACKO|nr:PREDICTED: uncharacterized protein LOC102810176 [Saccoglossus kowalevskii]